MEPCYNEVGYFINPLITKCILHGLSSLDIFVFLQPQTSLESVYNKVILMFINEQLVTKEGAMYIVPGLVMDFQGHPKNVRLKSCCNYHSQILMVSDNN